MNLLVRQSDESFPCVTEFSGYYIHKTNFLLIK